MALCVVLCYPQSLTAQNTACAIDLPSLSTNSPNIFNDRQEQDLGDALAEFFESIVPVAPPAADEQLTRIGDRLLATLPPTGIHYRFRIYDSGEINAFSIAGGRVYISRKLIAAVKNEDELAGVMAHEIGHISTHQSAIEITRTFRLRLGITQVTDRADIFAKVHLMFDTPSKDTEAVPRDDKNELVADRVGLYMMARAGYAVESFPAFFNQISLNKGKTGNWLTDVFGISHENSQRYRADLKLIDRLPTGCKGREPESGKDFQAWLKNTLAERVKDVAEGAAGDRPLQLDQPLRPSLSHIRFSPDGRYILAQDEGSITVVDKDSAKALLRIDAPDVEAAQFTPDSANVVFSDRKLRVEKWSVATGQRTSARELVVFGGCNQTLLTPDGKTLVCAKLNFQGNAPVLSLRLIDVDSGNPYYENQKFFEGSGFTRYNYLLIVLDASIANNLAKMIVSPDGRYLLVMAEQSVLAYDLKQRQQIKLGGKLKDLKQTRVSFLGPDQLYVVDQYKDKDVYKARIFSFPAGHVLSETKIGGEEIRAATKGQVLIVELQKDNAVGIFDPKQVKVLAAWKFSKIDVWDNQAAVEDATGGLTVMQIGAKGGKRIPLLLGPLPKPHAAAFSPDGNYLAVSLKSRAEIWDLRTGEKVGLIRPFSSAWMNNADELFGQFPKYLNWDPKELEYSLSPLAAKELANLDDKDRQYHDLQYRYKPMGKNESTNHHATLEVKKMETQAVAWSRDFMHETPAIWPASNDRMVLAWDLSSDTAKEEIKSYPDLQRQVEALKDKKKGILIETVNAETGAPLEQVIIPDVDLTSGLIDTRRAAVSGEFVLAKGERDNTAIYRLGNGAKVGEFFGSVVTSNAATGLAVAVNREDEILIVNLSTGKELKRFTLESPVRLAEIVSGKEKALLVLTANQVVHRFPLPRQTDFASVK